MNKLMTIWSKDQKEAKQEALNVKAEVFEAQTKVAVLKADGKVGTAERNLARAVRGLAGEDEPNLSILVKLSRSVQEAKDDKKALVALQTELFSKG